MTLLIIGLIVWFASHLVTIWAPDLHQALKEKLGALPAKALIVVVTLGAVILMVKGYQQAAYVELWLPPGFLVHVNNLLMILAVFVVIAGYLPSFVRRKIRHPQLTGVKIWALAHLLVNGDLAGVLLFGGMLAWAVLALIGSNRRDGPRGALPEANAQGLVAHIGLTLVIFSVMAYVHGMLLGVWPFPG